MKHISSSLVLFSSHRFLRKCLNNVPLVLTQSLLKLNVNVKDKRNVHTVTKVNRKLVLTDISRKRMAKVTALSEHHKLPQFLSDGKRHVLPLSILLQLKQYVRENTASVIDQINCNSSRELHTGKFTADSQRVLGAKETKEKRKSKKRKRQDSAQGKNAEATVEETDMESPWQTKSQQRKRTESSKSQEGNEAKPQKKQRPNYFVAVQITDSEIHETAKKIHTHILSKSEADLSPLVEEAHKFHITLMVMYLASDDEIKRASDALDKCAITVGSRTDGQPVQLDFQGLDNFNKGRVLFACIKDTEGLDLLHHMAGEVSKEMQEVGIFSTDKNRPFNPHLTLMKFQFHGSGMSQLLRQGIEGVQPQLYQPFVEEVFGSQKVMSLQLCSMQEKREDGYYLVVHESVFAA